MPPLSTILLAASAIWAVVGLAVQARGARPAGRTDHAARAGSAARGILYGFTGAMLPGKKESVSRHPVSFGAGLVFHAGVAAAFLALLLVTLGPGPVPPLRPALQALVAAGLLACCYLLARRLTVRDVHAVSVPDDYLANLALAVFLAVTMLNLAGALPAPILRLVAAVLLVYLPLGKLRHVLFFFLARGDLSRRLGVRGVYPPAR